MPPEEELSFAAVAARHICEPLECASNGGDPTAEACVSEKHHLKGITRGDRHFLMREAQKGKNTCVKKSPFRVNTCVKKSQFRVKLVSQTQMGLAVVSLLNGVSFLYKKKSTNTKRMHTCSAHGKN